MDVGAAFRAGVLAHNNSNERASRKSRYFTATFTAAGNFDREAGFADIACWRCAGEVSFAGS
jgi:hypothetical protein